MSVILNFLGKGWLGAYIENGDCEKYPCFCTNPSIFGGARKLIAGGEVFSSL